MASAASRTDSKWDAALDDHRVAMAAFVDAAERVRADAWMQPRAPGKWAPAQIVEHLTLAYEALLRELNEGTPLATRVPAWRQTLLRWIVLPHILFHRSFPVRAPAPREVRPSAGSPDRAAALVRIRALADRFERELGRARRAGGGRLTHPYFGAVGPVKVLRFCAVHLDHHRAQFPI
jgi:hypothetical protein